MFDSYYGAVKSITLLFICVPGTSVISHGSDYVMGQCNHEEAHTRIIVHVRHALERGAESVLVRTVDTDVVMILVGKFHDLFSLQPTCQIVGGVRHGVPLFANERQQNLFYPWRV